MVTCKVLFPYDAAADDELSLKEGDVIENVDQKDGGWWDGTLNGKRGCFPDNFVEVIPDVKKAAKPLAAAPAPVPAAAVAAPASTAPPLSAPGSSRPSVAKIAKKCKCTFDYDAANDDELSLKVGDIITIISQAEEGWWEGEMNGKSGVFPSNFVEELDAAAAAAADEDRLGTMKRVQGVGLGNIFASGAPVLRKVSVSNPVGGSKPPPAAGPMPTQNNLKPTTKAGASAPPPVASSAPEKKAMAPPGAAPAKPVAAAPPPAKPKEAPMIVKVQFDYDAVNPDELTLRTGQILRVTKKEDAGWWEGDLHGTIGWFPDNFVAPASAEELSVWEAKHGNDKVSTAASAPAPTHAAPPTPSPATEKPPSAEKPAPPKAAAAPPKAFDKPAGPPAVVKKPAKAAPLVSTKKGDEDSSKNTDSKSTDEPSSKATSAPVESSAASSAAGEEALQLVKALKDEVDKLRKEVKALTETLKAERVSNTSLKFDVDLLKQRLDA